MDEKLHKKLKQREEKGTLRSLSSFEGMIDFASNDYLGVARKESFVSEEVEQGATGSRLISGNSEKVEEVERELAEFFGSEAGLCFNSGYDANVGIFSSVPQRGDVVLYDEFIHASVRDGVRLSHAKSYSFNHNDTDDLRRLMELNKSSTIYIAVESLYSMHGDFCPLLEVIQLAEEYGAYVILDEAHTAGVFGMEGRGFAHALSLHSRCLLRLVTFGKAYGAHGAVVLTSESMRHFLVNFARSFIYTTALPAASYDWMKANVEWTRNANERAVLQQLIAYFRSKMPIQVLLSAINSPIQFVRFSSIEQLKSVEKQAREAQLFVKAIYAPTVPEGCEGLRVSIHSFNTQEEIDALVRIISA